jgi:hypothetical protein
MNLPFKGGSKRHRQLAALASAISLDANWRKPMLTIRKTALALTLVTFAGFSFASSAQAYQCKGNFTQVETHAKIRAKAKSLGRTYWTSTVKDNYGLQWSVWNIAASKSQSCEHTGNQWYCVTKAKPCLYVVQ